MRVDRFDCVDIISKCSRAAQFSCRPTSLSLSSAPDPGLSGCCTGSFSHPLLLCADAYWRPTRLPAPCVLLHVLRANTAALLRARTNLNPLCSIITSFAPSCNIRTRYNRVLPCFTVLALRPLLRCTWELHLGGGMPKIAVIRSIFSVVLKLQFWATCCRARRGIILLNIAHPYRVIICCGWCACARAELNCLF